VNLSHRQPRMSRRCALPSFARAMAHRGHQIVLMTRTSLDDEDPGVSGEELAQALDTHEWATPLHLAVKPKRDPLLRESSEPETLAKPLEQALTGMVFPAAWRASSVIGRKAPGCRSKSLQGSFATPTLYWATFLPTDRPRHRAKARGMRRMPVGSWTSRMRGSYRLPRGIRSLMARRFKNASGLTPNSRFHGMQGERWFKKKATTLHDGISDAFFNAKRGATNELFRIVLVGGTYGEERLARFLEGSAGVAADAARGGACLDSFHICGLRFRCGSIGVCATGLLENLCEVEILGYLLSPSSRSVRRRLW